MDNREKRWNFRWGNIISRSVNVEFKRFRQKESESLTVMPGVES